VIVWGVASRLGDEAIELYPTRKQAEATLEQFLRDEPEWRDVVYVARIRSRAHRALAELAGAEAPAWAAA